MSTCMSISIIDDLMPGIVLYFNSTKTTLLKNNKQYFLLLLVKIKLLY